MSLSFSEYNRNTPNQQMARRMDRKVIKLEAAYGSERQFIVVTRTQDLVVRDLMEDVQKTFKIPIDQQVIFHKGTNLCDFPAETLEALGVENNHPIRVTRDPELPNRTPRSRNAPNNLPGAQAVSQNQTQSSAPYQNDLTMMINQNMDRNNVVLKLYVSLGSEREYVLINGKKPLVVSDLKKELHKIFKIPPEQQNIVFKGYNIHDYLDEAPLDAFGLENNSPISLWPKGTNPIPDIRLPRSGTPPPQGDIFSPRIPPPPGSLTNRWQGAGEAPSEILKIEVQHGSDRHMVLLKGQNKNLTVLDLQNELERVTAVAVRDQKIFYKSQELHATPFRTLRECELENNSVIKLVGEPSKVRYSNYFGRLSVPNSQNNPNSQPFPSQNGGGFPPQQFNQPQINQFGQPSFQPNYINQSQGYQPSFYQQQQQQPPQQQQQANPQINYGYGQNF